MFSSLFFKLMLSFQFQSSIQHLFTVFFSDDLRVHSFQIILNSFCLLFLVCRVFLAKKRVAFSKTMTPTCEPFSFIIQSTRSIRPAIICKNDSSLFTSPTCKRYVSGRMSIGASHFSSRKHGTDVFFLPHHFCGLFTLKASFLAFQTGLNGIFFLRQFCVFSHLFQNSVFRFLPFLCLLDAFC